MSAVRPAGDGDGPGGRRSVRPLRPPAASVRELQRSGGSVRPLLRILRSRDGSWREPHDVVAAVAGRGAGAAGSGPDLRHSRGTARGEIDTPPRFRGEARTTARGRGPRYWQIPLSTKAPPLCAGGGP